MSLLGVLAVHLVCWSCPLFNPPSCLLQFLGSRLHRLDDVLVTGAAADVAGDARADLFFGRVWVFLKQLGRARDHARCAETTLKAVMFLEVLLQDVQRIRAAESFDCRDFCTIGLGHKDGAGFHGFAVHCHRAGAAVRCLAANMRSGDVEFFAQRINQQLARFGQ